MKKKVEILMIFKYGDMSVVFTSEVISLFEKYKQIERKQHESGGILLGKIYNDLIIIDNISEPSKEDKSGRYYFYRDVKKAQNITEKAWKESNGERIYLGEWHTHPEDIPTPSWDDKKLIKDMLKHSRMEIDFLLMVIIGRVSPYVAILNKGMKHMVALDRVIAKNGLHIIFYKNQNGQIYGFQVNGYLNFAPNGYDIYNAAFSQIFLGTINSIYHLTEVKDYIFEQEKAFIRYIIPEIGQVEEKVQTLLDAMEVQVKMLMKELNNKNLATHVKVEVRVN